MSYLRTIAAAVLFALAATTSMAQEIQATIQQAGFSVNAGFGSVWMVNLGTMKLLRVNPSNNSITEIPLPGGIGPFGNAGMAFGDGAVWLPDHGRGMIFKIDPATNRVAQEIPAELLGNGVISIRAWDAISVGNGSVWALSSNKELRRYSTDNGRQAAAIALPSRSTGVIAAFGSVWVTGTENDELYRIDPLTNQIVATVDLHDDPRSLAASEGSVWVLSEGDGAVQRIDGKSGEVVATIDTHAVGRGSITAGGGFVWISTPSDPIVQIDPRTNSVRSKFKVEMGEYSTICFGGSSLWLSGHSLRRIKPPE